MNKEYCRTTSAIDESRQIVLEMQSHMMDLPSRLHFAESVVFGRVLVGYVYSTVKQFTWELEIRSPRNVIGIS